MVLRRARDDKETLNKSIDKMGDLARNTKAFRQGAKKATFCDKHTRADDNDD
jgi:hypothetical protein